MGLSKAMRFLILNFWFGVFCMQNVYSTSWWEMTPLQVRARINERIMDIEAPVSPVWTIENRIIKNGSRTTPVRVYLPNQNENLPIILLIHGGAWVAGNLDTHDNLARYLCSQVEAIVVSVGYMNAPEGKFPLQLHQSLDALEWIANHENEFPVNPSKLAIVGDSAGGNMAAALCLMVRDLQGPKIDLQVLINPAPDLRCNGTIEPQDDSLDILRWQASHYVSTSEEVNNPYVSPLNASDLSNLPTTLVLLAENDELRSDGECFVRRLKESGVPTFVYLQKGIGHLAGHGARASLQAKESLEVTVIALKCAFLKDNDFKEIVLNINNAFYNESGDSFDKIPFDSLLPSLLSKYVIGRQILEIGSGAGALAYWLTGQGYQVYCIEPAIELAKQAEKKGLNVCATTIKDFEADLQYDNVVAISSLIHVPKSDLPQQVKKISYLLKRHGVFFVSFIEGEGEALEDPTKIGKFRYFAKWSDEELDNLFSSDFILLENHKIYNKRMDCTFLLRIYKKTD